jgi:polysaccharide deacetylase family protein (PEP-CTERM system associated)
LRNPAISPSGRIRNAFTVDVEDYFHVEAFSGVIRQSEWEKYPPRVERNTHRLLDILDEFGVKGTFFVLGWVAERASGVLQRIVSDGHEIACHGYSHRPLNRMTPEEFRADLRQSKGILENITGHSVSGYRAPTFSITQDNQWALTVLAEEGFLYDSSVFPIHHDRYGWTSFPRTIVRWEGKINVFPISTLRVLGVNLPFSGGGYLRVLPYWLIRESFRRVNCRENNSVVLYVHPWEIDSAQPRVPIHGFSSFRHYVNIGSMEFKLRRLLDDFSFGRMDDVLMTASSGAGA